MSSFLQILSKKKSDQKDSSDSKEFSDYKVKKIIIE